ncbi:TraJ [Klebsiella pneumoniae]|uniref:TraJ n=1 Tax=Klebsiella pneumoniae TaxID=573 RepID=A0A2X3BPQ1_KLEPN|nr:TraJ [Klebsiella pneumoniae]
MNASKLLMDVERWQEVTRNTEKTFNYLFVELNITAYLNKTLLPEDDKTKPARGMNLAANKFMSRAIPLPKHPVNGVSGDLPLVFAGWLVFYIPPLMIALALDGYYQWKMKRFVFGDVTIQLYRLWFRSLSIIGVLIIAYLVIPNLNLFYGLTQYFPPLALALLAIAINRLLAHYQKLM